MSLEWSWRETVTVLSSAGCTICLRDNYIETERREVIVAAMISRRTLTFDLA